MRSSRRTILADVAARAGVSVTTASYVLNGRAEEMRISSEAAARVSTAAEQLSYRPNHNARSLRTSRTSTLGIVSDHLASGQYASQMLSGAAAAARARGHLVVIAETGGDPMLEEQLIQELLDRRVDGILYATLSARRVDVPESLGGTRLVLLNCTDPEREVACVVPDEMSGGRLAARTVLGAGAAERLYVVGEDPSLDTIAGLRRMRGILAELAEHDGELAGVVPCAWEVRPAYDAVSARLTSGDRPTGLVCLNDRIAMGAYQALAAYGLEVPGDVSVVSFDGSGLATWLRPELSSVAIPFHRAGGPGRAAAAGPRKATARRGAGADAADAGRVRPRGAGPGALDRSAPQRVSRSGRAIVRGGTATARTTHEWIQHTPSAGASRVVTVTAITTC